MQLCKNGMGSLDRLTHVDAVCVDVIGMIGRCARRMAVSDGKHVIERQVYRIQGEQIINIIRSKC